MRRLRGKVRIECPEMLLEADEIDYNQTGEDDEYAEARGNVHYKNFETNEEIWASKVEYYLNQEKGKFYDPKGTTEARVDARPGLLTTSQPFYFEGQWAERTGARYILHEGMITNCKMPRPWWTLRGPSFDIIPNERALAHNAIFRVKKIPLFFTPYFYKSLEKLPRRSGLLTPNVGHSSRLGWMFALGYYWAINRSYDLSYRIQEFTARGQAHHVDFRAKPRQGTDIDLIFYGVADRGQLQGNGDRIKQGGFSIASNIRSELGHGFQARGQINYLSSLVFRQAFTESFQEAVGAEVHSEGFITKQWSSYSFTTSFTRIENFQSAEPGDAVQIRRLPEISFAARDREVAPKWNLPIWVSLDSRAGLLSRSQPLFQTRQFLERADIQPRVMTALRWKDFHLLPSFSMRGTHWGERSDAGTGRISGENLNRTSREFFADLVMPSLQRTFTKKTRFGEQLKHVIEPRASFRHVAGVLDFDRQIRFDETELLANTTEAEISITNRLYAKRGGQVSEVLSWQVWQRRYFNPDFGGAVVDGRRNVVLSSVELTPYTFLDQGRRYSPVISALRASLVPGWGIEWRADYDPLRGHFVNSGLSTDARFGEYFLSAGHNQVRSVPTLSPNTNQFRGVFGYGKPNHRGWNAAFTSIYDYRERVLRYATTEIAYNTDCCGLSFQVRRFDAGVRKETRWFASLAIANIGSIGTLKKQEKMF